MSNQPVVESHIYTLRRTKLSDFYFLPAADTILQAPRNYIKKFLLLLGLWFSSPVLCLNVPLNTIALCRCVYKLSGAGINARSLVGLRWRLLPVDLTVMKSRPALLIGPNGSSLELRSPMYGPRRPD